MSSEGVPRMVRATNKKTLGKFLAATSQRAPCNDCPTQLIGSAGHANEWIYYLRLYSIREIATH